MLRFCDFRGGTEEINDEYWRYEDSVCAHSVCIRTYVYILKFVLDIIFQIVPEVNIGCGKKCKNCLKFDQSASFCKSQQISRALDQTGLRFFITLENVTRNQIKHYLNFSFYVILRRIGARLFYSLLRSYSMEGNIT
jgi:hypothetical protein